jgi:hypothetical protein
MEQSAVELQQEHSNVNALNFEIDALKRQVEVLKHQQDKNKYSLDEIKLAIKISYGIKYFSETKFLENLEQLKKK